MKTPIFLPQVFYLNIFCNDDGKVVTTGDGLPVKDEQAAAEINEYAESGWTYHYTLKLFNGVAEIITLEHLAEILRCESRLEADGSSGMECTCGNHTIHAPDRSVGINYHYWERD